MRMCPMNTQQYSSDSPIALKELDQFNRYPFSQRIAEIIATRCDPSSMIIGIYGKWGYGKTSVLNFMKTELIDNPASVTISFNPWRFSNEDQMLLSFFSELAASIGKSLPNQKEKIVDTVAKYVTPVASFLGKEETLKGLKSLLSEPDLEELKTRIESILSSEKKRIVVFIDDIDRLDVSEIQAVFRLVKLTANFNYLTFVLAFDKDLVISALNNKFVYNSESIGESFLEKIIQIPLQLPQIHDSDLQAYCFKEIDNVLSANNIELSSEEVNNFVMNFTGTIEYFLTSPRQVKLYCNILQFSLPMLAGEVNTVDLMLIEAVRIFLPKVYAFVQNRKDIFINNMTSRIEPDSKFKDSIINSISDTLNNLSDYEKIHVIDLLLYLFPKLNNVYNNIEYGNLYESEWIKDKRIASRDYFQRYFSYSISLKDISDVYLENILKNIDSFSNDYIKSEFIDIITNGQVHSLIKKLRFLYVNLSPIQINQIVLAFSTLSHMLPNPIQFFYQSNPFHQASFLIGQCIEKLENSTDRDNLALLVINQSSTLSFSVECYINFPKNSLERPNPRGFTDEKLSIFETRLCERISSELIDFENYTLKELTSLPQILYLWNKYGNEIDYLEQFQTLLEKNPKVVNDILDSYTPIASSDKGVRRSEFRKNSYDSLINVIDPNLIQKALLHTFTDLPDDENYPEYIIDARDRKLARQFLWFYNNLNK